MNPRMKHLLFSLFLVVQLLLMASGPSAEELALLKARRYGAEAKECLRVVDQDGAPVAGATMRGALQTGGGRKDFIPIRGVTDTNGEFVIQGKCTEIIRCSITKDGYYPSEFKITDYGYSHELKDGKWIPYGTSSVMALRPIRKLGTLSVPNGRGSGVGRWQIPAMGRWLGFDFDAFDWTAPFGVGVKNDVLLKFTSEMNNAYFDFRFSMDVCFTNHPFAGAYVCKKRIGSDFAWDESADTNKVFASEFSFENKRSPDGVRVANMLTEDSCMVFRTRTKLDRNGKLVSAHYGVISGAWLFGNESMRFDDACFNPNANDTSIEDGYYLRKRVKEQTMSGK